MTIVDDLTITSSKLRFFLVQNAFFLLNTTIFAINFQGKKGLFMPMPIFKVTAEGPRAFDVFLTSS